MIGPGSDKNNRWGSKKQSKNHILGSMALAQKLVSSNSSQFLRQNSEILNVCMHFLMEVLIFILSHDNLREVVNNFVGKVNGTWNDCHYVTISLWCWCWRWSILWVCSWTMSLLILGNFGTLLLGNMLKFHLITPRLETWFITNGSFDQCTKF